MLLTEATIVQQALGLGQARCWHPPRCGYCEKTSAVAWRKLTNINMRALTSTEDMSLM